MNIGGALRGAQGYTSFTIASPTGEGLTTALSFSRIHRAARSRTGFAIV